MITLKDLYLMLLQHHGMIFSHELSVIVVVRDSELSLLDVKATIKIAELVFKPKMYGVVVYLHRVSAGDYDNTALPNTWLLDANVPIKLISNDLMRLYSSEESDKYIDVKLQTRSMLNGVIRNSEVVTSQWVLKKQIKG